MAKNYRAESFFNVLNQVQAPIRAQRMKAFSQHVNLRPGMRVIDLGGSPLIWASVEVPLKVSIVNLPGVLMPRLTISRHQFTFFEADACDLPQFADNEFDLAFSNSVIEHVGPAERQTAFARQVKRLAPAYWVQTPSICFPLEAHTGLPFWWFYPRAVRAAVIARWRKSLPDWTAMIEGTRVLTKRQLRSLFPGASFFIERLAGLPKSIAVYRA